MSEFLSRRATKSVGAVIGILLTSASCASDTLGNGFLAEQGTCIEYESELVLPLGKTIRVAVDDISARGFGNAFKDYAKLTNNDGILDVKTGNDQGSRVVYKVGNSEASTDSDIEVDVTGNSVVLIREDGSSMELTPDTNGDDIELHIKSICNTDTK